MDKAALLLTGLLILPAGEALDVRTADAEVNINIGINAPPRFVVASPPEVILIPGTGVYFAPDTGFELFFYSGHWYRRHERAWYRAPSYSGSWVYIPPQRIPAVFVHLPRDYHRYYGNHRRISHGQLRKEWKLAEREHRKREKEHRKHEKEHRKDRRHDD